MWILTLALYIQVAQATDKNAVPNSVPKMAPVSRPVIWTKGFYAPLKARFPKDTYDFMDSENARKDLLAEGLFSQAERDAIFAKAGVASKVVKMDELDKDMLTMGAKQMEVPELVRRYPALSEPDWKRLKIEVEKVK